MYCYYMFCLLTLMGDATPTDDLIIEVLSITSKHIYEG